MSFSSSVLFFKHVVRHGVWKYFYSISLAYLSFQNKSEALNLIYYNKTLFFPFAYQLLVSSLRTIYLVLGLKDFLLFPSKSFVKVLHFPFVCDWFWINFYIRCEVKIEFSVFSFFLPMDVLLLQCHLLRGYSSSTELLLYFNWKINLESSDTSTNDEFSRWWAHCVSLF